MKKRHLQVRFVKDEEPKEAAEPMHFPVEEVQDVVVTIFIGIAALMVVSTIGKIAVYKAS